MENTETKFVPPKVNHIRWIKNIYSERGGLILLLLFLTLLSSVVAVIFPYLSKRLLETIQGLLDTPGVENPMAEVNRFLFVFGIVGIGVLITSIFPGLRGMTNSIFEHLIRMKYFRKIMAKDHKFYSHFPTGDVVTRLTDDLMDFSRLPWFLCSGIFRAVESISKVIFCLIAMFLIHPSLTLYSIIPIPIMIIIFYLTSDKVETTFQKNQEAISSINSRLEMSFSGVRIIKAYSCEDKYRRFFQLELKNRFRTEFASAHIEILLHLIYQYIDYIAQVGVIFAGGMMAVQGKISIGTFYAFYTYLNMLIYPILDIPRLFVSGKRAFVNIDRLEEMAAFPNPLKPASPKKLESIESIEFRDVGFRYANREDAALKKLNVTITRGERLGIIGPVGSGKSSLIKMILGLIKPQEGQILVNGEDILNLDMEDYRKKLSYVPQEALLFSGTLRENVDFGSDEPTDELFEKAVDAAQMQEEIADFSEGQETVVGQRGISLSGGQKQRMAIARAVAHRGQIMLFDDITASLDAANEERLMKSLEEMYRDMGFIIVSHRLSTLQYVDKVLFLDEGKPVNFGTHEELMKKDEYRSFIEEHLVKLDA